jgi:CRP/FNR family transcriptional regulator, cyclic AMP receptor protein
MFVVAQSMLTREPAATELRGVTHKASEVKVRKLKKDTIQRAPQPLSHIRAKSVSEALSARLFHAAQPRHFKAGERLFAVEDAGDGCYRLDQGLLKVAVVSPLEERIISILGPGAIVGELAMIDELPRSASVVALKDSVLRFVSREAFKQCANAHPEVHQILLAILAARLRQVDDALAANTFLTVKARVARALLELAEHIGQPSSAGHIVFHERISQADLAAMAGVARENVSRVLSEWRRRKIVTGSLRCHCVNDSAALKREMNSGTERGRETLEEMARRPRPRCLGPWPEW